MLLDGSLAQLRRQALIGLIPFKRIVREQDLVDAGELHGLQPDAGVPVGFVMRYRVRNLREQGVFGGVLGNTDHKGFAVVGQQDRREREKRNR